MLSPALERGRILHDRAVFQLNDAVATRQHAFGAEVGEAAAETCQVELTLHEAILNGAPRSCGQCIQPELLTPDGMPRRHQALAQLRDLKLFTGQAGTDGVMQALGQLV